ncbi:MAG: hypothetical protein WCZ89_07220 [Phycisphaerae bacterium]
MAENLNSTLESEDANFSRYLEDSNSKTDLWKWITVLCWIAMMIFAFHASTHMVGAGDTWVALTCGRHFINHGVDTVEPFSANSHKAGPTEETMAKYAQELRDSLRENQKNPPGLIKKTLLGLLLSQVERYPDWSEGTKQFVSKVHPTGWINQNWLTHVIFYWLTHLSPVADADPDNGVYSYNTLVYWKIILYVLTVICVYYTGRILGANVILSAVFACGAMFIGRSFLDIRPAGYSNLLTAVFLLVIVLATYRNVLYIWLLVPVTVFWCNLHGGYIYVFIMLVPFIVINFISCFFPKRCISIGKRGLIHSIAASAATLTACIIFNPFHLTNFTHTFEISISEHAEMWRTVHEWHPGFAWDNPVGTGFPYLVLFLMFIGVLVLWLISRFLKPWSLKAPQNEMEFQKKFFVVLSNILGWASAILLFWLIFISLSFCHADPASFFICVAFIGIILISVTNKIHFIWALVPLTLFIVILSDEKAGYSGRYIYPFLILPCYAGISMAVSFINPKKRFSCFDILFAAAASIAAIVLMVTIVNPFNFAPVTDGFISYIRQFFTIRRIWRPIYEVNLGFLSNVYTHLFTGLYIANLIFAGIWLMFMSLQNERKAENQSHENQLQNDASKWQNYETPRIDFVYIVIAALSIYLAYRSRRFIPIAGYAACPLLALLIEQMARVFSASRNFHTRGILAVSPVNRNIQKFLLCAGVVLVTGFGGYWGWKFKVVYLDSWPLESFLTSTFMRMTASASKPFFATKFIKDNELSGKMFNYWTEGGFIAYGQEPDPVTGRTPLQLFMDGRAQAAYDPSAFYLWSEIMAGTREGSQIITAAHIRERSLTADDYRQIGNAISQRLKQLDVWVILMPANDKTDTFLRIIESTPDWICTYVDMDQKLYVDVTTEKGQQLYQGLFDGSTIFPNEFSKYFTLAENILFKSQDAESAKEGLEYAFKAIEIRPSQKVMNLIVSFSHFNDREMIESIIRFCNAYFEDYFNNIEKYRKEHGYVHKLGAVASAGNFLGRLAESNKNTRAIQYYSEKLRFLSEEARNSQRYKVW